MFGLGFQELLIIFVVAIIVVGPKKLPDLAKALGKGLAEFRRAAQDIKSSIDSHTGMSELKETMSNLDLESDLDVEYSEEDEYEEVEELEDTREPEETAQAEPADLPARNRDEKTDE